MSNETKKEFLQKYMLDSYSRAIPTHALQGKTAALGEYCDPVDSYKNKNKRHTEDSEDSDPGYALPQDALGNRVNQKNLASKTRRSLDDDEGGDVYELAQNPVEEPNASKSHAPLSKPSPKPRPSARRSQTVDYTSKPEASLTKSSSLEDANYRPSADTVTGEEASSQRRPSKRCVEIEYEIASDIRQTKPGPGPPAPQASPAMPIHTSHGKVSSDSRANRKSSSNQHTRNTQVIPVSAPVKGAQGNKANLVHSVSQPAPVPQAESMYEEPWDLKARRLKQEEERASRISMTKTDFSVAPPALSSSEPVVAKQESVYEDAWDTAAQQRKLEARLNFARSLSTTSETSEIFHDALDNLPQSKSDASTKKATEPKIKPLPTDTYEDAWDLKNTILDQKLRAMQVQASATYEEPWDLKKQHQQLQSRLSAANPTTSSTEPASGPSRGVKQRTSFDSYDQSWPGSDSHSSSPATSRSSSKQHSTDDPKKASTKSRGSNIGQRINPMIPLPNQNWYHGNITRDDAEKMLRVCKEGSYIVRISSDRKSYSLSIKSAKQNIHIQIEQVGLLDGSVRYILGKNSREFCSIPEMIDYYTHHRVPLKGAEHITLLHPVECKWSSNNSQ